MSAFNYPTHEIPVADRGPESNSVGAVIDIGSNSVKLLVGQVRGNTVERIYSTAAPVKLGQGTFQTRWLRPEAIERVTGTVAEFARSARNFSPCVFRVLATSAVREAINRFDLVRAVQTRAQTRVEILSGKEEAQLLFEGVRREPGLAGAPLMVVDLGGGSTQLVVSESGTGALCYSFPFGSLRLIETLGLSDPLSRKDLARCRASAANFVLHQVIPAIGQTRFEGGPFNTMRLVGTGKKLRVLAQAGNSRKNLRQSDGMVSLTPKRLTVMIEGLWEMTRRERATILAISEEDAEVILTAAVTLEAILHRFDFEVVHASQSSVRQGAILRSFAERRTTALPNQWR
jgi:exopolyphosphatase/guanosine-5'-triphosphate,3'-diphosphate pyrophosphatase